MESQLKIGDVVEAKIVRFSPLGAFASFENGGWGLIYQDDIYTNLAVGDVVTAYIKTIREDGKIDLTLRNLGYRNFINSTTESIIDKLKEAGGSLPYNDNSSPDRIKQKFQMSKSQFKQAIGKLYKEKLIVITETGIEIV